MNHISLTAWSLKLWESMFWGHTSNIRITKNTFPTQPLPPSLHNLYHLPYTTSTTFPTQPLPPFLHNLYHLPYTTSTTFPTQPLPPSLHNLYHNEYLNIYVKGTFLCRRCNVYLVLKVRRPEATSVSQCVWVKSYSQPSIRLLRIDRMIALFTSILQANCIIGLSAWDVSQTHLCG